MGSPRCGGLRQFAMDLAQLSWVAELWVGQTGQSWLQLLKGASSIISALLTPSLSLAPFSFADSTGEPGGFCLTPAALCCSHWSALRGKLHWHSASTTTTVSLVTAQHTEPLHQSRHPVLRSDIPRQRPLQAARIATPGIAERR